MSVEYGSGLAVILPLVEAAGHQSFEGVERCSGIRSIPGSDIA